LKIKNNKVFVTGADGFIGSHLCEALVNKGAKVKAFVLYNSFNKLGWLEDLPKEILKNIEVISGDIRDQDLLFKVVRGTDTIFHLASLISIPYSYVASRSYLITNTLGTLNILEAAKLYGCQKIITTSTSEIYGTAIKPPIDEEHKIQAQSPYSASKISADLFVESYVKSFNLPAVIMRPFNTFGPRQSERAVIPSIIRQVLDDKINLVKVGNLDTKRDFNYVDDTVSAFMSLAEAKSKDVSFGTPYNAGTGKSVSIYQVLKKIIKITGSNKKIKKEQKRVRPKNSEVFNLIACSKKLNRLTDWSPEYSLEQGLEKTIDWWKKRKEADKIRISNDYAI
tara:strand:+ start:10 stop:1023 length:1014 start_codon:yes stop_codon:yes gene_type:complete